MDIGKLEKLKAEAEENLITFSELCSRAGIHRSTISKARAKGVITIKLYRRLRLALDELKADGVKA